MKIHVMSDLHLEFGDLPLDPSTADVVVLAGDIAVGPMARSYVDMLQGRLERPVVWIAGNHEHYRGVLPENLRDYRAAGRPGVVEFLEDSTAVVEGIRFIGCTLWTDYDLYGDWAGGMRLAGRSMTDHRLGRVDPETRFMPEHALAFFNASRAYLEARLSEDFDGPTVVVTHHCPSAKSVAPQFIGDPLSPAFASNLDDLVRSSGARLWVHGHTHTSFDYSIGETRVVCNPRGYVGHELNPDFRDDLVIEVG